jgi:hypothetical protein
LKKKGVVEKRREEETKSMPHATVNSPRNWPRVRYNDSVNEINGLRRFVIMTSNLIFSVCLLPFRNFLTQNVNWGAWLFNFQK